MKTQNFIFTLTLAGLTGTAARATLSAERDSGAFMPTLIGGHEVSPAAYPAIIRLNVGGGRCSGTVVGPHVILTAGHCNLNGSATFVSRNRTYVASLHTSPNFNKYMSLDSNVDMALGYVKEEIGIRPVSVGGVATIGEPVELFGYGCTTSQGKGGNDGTLRTGSNHIYAVASGRFRIFNPNEAPALCPGDSGGPAFIKSHGQLLQLGVNSRGDLHANSLDTRLDNPLARTFMQKFANENKTSICGITKRCN